MTAKKTALDFSNLVENITDVTGKLDSPEKLTLGETTELRKQVAKLSAAADKLADRHRGAAAQLDDVVNAASEAEYVLGDLLEALREAKKAGLLK